MTDPVLQVKNATYQIPGTEKRCCFFLNPNEDFCTDTLKLPLDIITDVT